MTRRSVVSFVIGAALYGTAFSQPSVVVTQESVVLKKTGGDSAVILKDSTVIAFGDSLMTGQFGEATVHIGDFQLMLKGFTRLVLTEKDQSVTANLLQGQLFMKRDAPHQTTFFMATLKGCTVIPIGTAAALKYTAEGEPSVAVIRGSIRMEAPDGQSVTVLPGQFATFSASGAFTQGALPPQAVASLEQWSGVKKESAAEETAAAPAVEAKPEPPVAAQPATQPPATPPPPPPAVAAEPPPTPPQPPAEQARPEKKPEPATAPAVADKPADKPAAPPAETATTDKPEQKTEKTGEAEDEAGKEAGKEEKGADDKGREKPQWEISAGSVTVNGEQWTRVALGVDVPIWKFGVFFDVELFIDRQGQFSDKGWNFKDDWVEALTRKIRYIRFGHENDPLFIKFGGLGGVTLGYGFIVDRFTNMLHYPDEKLLGLQFYLNDISPIGITVQTLVADFLDFGNDGGVVAARLGLKPLKMTEIPILKGTQIAGAWAMDINQYAPARKWDFTLTGPIDDADEDNIKDGPWVEDFFYRLNGDSLTNAQRQNAIADTLYDTLVEHRDRWAERTTDRFQLVGGDVGIPIITGNFLGLDVYGQAATRVDGVSGWGFGAPGVALKVGPAWANVEYRHIQGRFTPGYFGTYYLDERLERNPTITTKADRLSDVALNGVFGKLGMNIADILTVSGSYQMMVGDEDAMDQRYEATAGIGEKILGKIPKINVVEGYISKTNVAATIVEFDAEGIPVLNTDGDPTYDKFFEKTPYLYYGYRVGIEITKGATLIWDARYGYKYDNNNNLVPNNNVSIQTAITF